MYAWVYIHIPEETLTTGNDFDFLPTCDAGICVLMILCVGVSMTAAKWELKSNCFAANSNSHLSALYPIAGARTITATVGREGIQSPSNESQRKPPSVQHILPKAGHVVQWDYQ